jgi:hypothetical protein
MLSLPVVQLPLRPGFLDLLSAAVAAEGSVPLGIPRASATCVQTSLPSVSQDPQLDFY